MNPPELKQLLKTPDGKILRDFLTAEIMKLRDINNIPNLPIHELNLEVKARQLAFDKLVEILGRLTDVAETKPKPSKDNYHYIPK